MEISFWIAILSGIATFFSPCIIPVLPGFFAFLGSSQDLKKAPRMLLVGETVIFTLGFLCIFVLLGTGAQVFGKPLAAQQDIFEKIGGIFIIFFGLVLLKALPSPFRSYQFPVLKNTSRVLRNFVFGLTFGFAWSPCIGPILATILYIATGEETAFEGGFLLFLFSIGLAIPFWICAFFVPELRKVLSKISLFAKFSQIIFGIILIILGIFLFNGKLAEYSGLLIQELGTGFIF